MDSRTTIELLVREPNTTLGRRVYWIVNRICVTQLFQLTRFFETSRLAVRDNKNLGTVPAFSNHPFIRRNSPVTIDCAKNYLAAG